MIVRLVSCGCHNILPQTGWLTEMHFLRILRTRSLKSRCPQGCAHSGTQQENLFLPRLASVGCRHSLVCGYITPMSASVFTWPSALYLCLPFLQGHLFLDLGPNRIIQYDRFSRASLTSAKTPNNTWWRQVCNACLLTNSLPSRLHGR